MLAKIEDKIKILLLILAVTLAIFIFSKVWELILAFIFNLLARLF